MRGERERARALGRTKLAAAGLLVLTAGLFLVARHLEPVHWGWGYVAAFAAAATVGGLADWYAVVALFRRPLGLPIPHTAIVPRNHLRIADTLGEFIETNFLAPEPVEARLREVDFAALIADWLSDRTRSAALAGFVVRLLPQSLGAIEQSGLRDFLGRRLMPSSTGSGWRPWPPGCWPRSWRRDDISACSTRFLRRWRSC